MASSEDIEERLNAALANRYRIEREIGVGGMATVFLAEDLKHLRKVALKVLKTELSAVVGSERFLAEIETTASLQHPNILPLFDSGEADGLLFYVMPFVEGESLREKLDREKQLSWEEAVRIATDVAEALQAAHEQGVIHRDVKPANILLSRGRPLVADFGIALAVGVAGGHRLTETGVSLGTPHYMSPEQATGDQTVASMTDTYSLGCVLYEMLIGDPPFTGSTAQVVLGKIIATEPASVRAQRRSVPMNVDGAIAKALEKLPADRFRRAGEFAEALVDHGFQHGVLAQGSPSLKASIWNPLTAGFAALAATLAIILGWTLFTTPEVLPGARATFRIEPPEGHRFGVGRGTSGVALSPDGERLAFLAYDEQVFSGTLPHPDAVGPALSLFIRSMDALEATPIGGTTNARDPFFSPDGEWLGFWQDGEIRKVSVHGGPVTSVAVAPAMLGASWASGGFIIYGDGTGLVRVSDGGESLPVPITAPGPRREFRDPFILRDQTAALVAIRATRPDGQQNEPEISWVSLETGEIQALGLRGSRPHLSESGFLLFVADGDWIHAVQFDLEGLSTFGAAKPVEEVVTGRFDVSPAGVMASLRFAVTDSSHCEWIKRDGSVERAFPEWVGEIQRPRLSSDGKRLAAGSFRDGIWSWSLPDGRFTSVVRGSGFHGPEWSRDEGSLVYVEKGGVYVKHLDAAGPASLVFQDTLTIVEASQTPEGRWLILRTDNQTQRRGDIFAIAWGASSGVEEIVATAAEEVSPRISPTGEWLAYVSDESGQREVYVSPFPNHEGTQRQVSLNGGTEPVWAHSGKEIFYRNKQMDLVAVEVTTEPYFDVLGEDSLFSTADHHFSGLTPQYDVGLDDQLFIFIRDHRVETAELVVAQAFVERLGEGFER